MKTFILVMLAVLVLVGCGRGVERSSAEVCRTVSTCTTANEYISQSAPWCERRRLQTASGCVITAEDWQYTPGCVQPDKCDPWSGQVCCEIVQGPGPKVEY